MVGQLDILAQTVALLEQRLSLSEDRSAYAPPPCAFTATRALLPCFIACCVGIWLEYGSRLELMFRQALGDAAERDAEGA